MKRLFTLISAALLSVGSMYAVINQNSCKFLGNITTSGQIQPNAGGLRYEDLWDQLTCENETKLDAIVNCTVNSGQEGVQKWSWTTADSHYNWCKKNGVMFKFHALLWTSQFPKIWQDLSASELKKQVGYWFDAVAIKYPDLVMIDVVNEALSGHAETTDKQGRDGKKMKNLLSQALGNSSNPYDYKWIAEAFRMARDRFPNAILIYNDFNTFTWDENRFVDLVVSLVDQGAPIDGYGHQSHDLDEYYSDVDRWGGISSFGATLKRIHNNITQKAKKELQCYITEYDISQGNETTYETIMENTFKPMWEAEFVSGITIWGYINGRTWRSNTGLFTSTGGDRSGIKWLRNYMATDAAKNAKSKFCGKDAGGASVSVSASPSMIVLGNSVNLTVSLNGSKTAARSITLYDGTTKIGEGEKVAWTPQSAGNHTINAVVVTTDNKEYKGSVAVNVVEPNKPYGGTAAVIPGRIEAENYDEGASGMAFFDKTEGNTCDKISNYYRKDDVDLKEISGGAAVGSFEGDEWMSYTVNVMETGEYTVTMRLGEGADAGSLNVSLDKSNASFNVKVNKIGDWGVFEEVKLDNVTLQQGEQNMVIKNTGSWIDVDWIEFKKVGTTGVDEAAVVSVSIAPNPATDMVEVYGVTPTRVDVISMEGVILKSCEESSFSVADLQNGNYIVRIVSEEGVTMKRLVVRK